MPEVVKPIPSTWCPGCGDFGVMAALKNALKQNGIKPDDTVTRRDVKLGVTQDNLAVIESGLRADDHLVVEGQYRLSEGAKVRYSTRTAVNAGQ